MCDAYREFDCSRTEPSPRKLSAREGREGGGESSGCMNGDSTSVADIVFCACEVPALSVQTTRELPPIATAERRSSLLLTVLGLVLLRQA